MRNKRVRPTRSRSSSSYKSSLMGRDLFTADVSFGSSFFGTSSSSTEPAPQDGLWEEDASGINSEPIVVHGPVEMRNGKFVFHENAVRSVQVAGPAMGVFGEEEGQAPEGQMTEDQELEVRKKRRREAAYKRKWDPVAGVNIYQLYDIALPECMEDENVIKAVEQAWVESRPDGYFRSEYEKPIEQGGWILPDGNGGYFLKRRPAGEGHDMDLGVQPENAKASFHTQPNAASVQAPSGKDLKRMRDKVFTVPMVIRARKGFYVVNP